MVSGFRLDWFKDRGLEKEAACANLKDTRTLLPCKLAPEMPFPAAHFTAARQEWAYLHALS